MVVFGRQAEQIQLQQMLDLASDRPTGIAIEGVPGIGKTALWLSAIADARQRDYQVISTVPGEPDAALAFSGLCDLLDSAPEQVLAGLPEPQRRALAAALALSDTIDRPSDPLVLPRAVLTVLRALAAPAPLLIAIDDEQWLDRSSARVLAFALARVRRERICVLLGRRADSDGALWPELQRSYAGGQLERLRLGPLEDDAVHALLAAHLKRKVGRPVVRRVHEISGGNPLYALAIAREVDEQAMLPDFEALPIPPTLSDAIARRLAGLDQRAAGALLVAAAVSAPSLALVQSVLPDFALGDLDTAVGNGLVDLDQGRVRFTHPLLASIHYSQTPPARRRQLHRILAEVYVSDPEEHAHHLALGAEAPNHQIAVTLEQAAAKAARRGAPEIAAALLEQASRLTPADAEAAVHSRLIAAAEQHYASGDLSRSRSGLESLLDRLPPGPTRARALLQLAKLRFDDFSVAIDLAEQALSNAAGQDRVSAQIELVLGELHSNAGDQRAAAQHATAAIGHAERANDPGLLAQTLAFAGMMAFFNGEGVQSDLMERAIALEQHAESTPSYYLPRSSLGNQLLWSDLLDHARPLLQGSLARAIARSEESDRAGLTFHLAHLEWEAGNNDDAQRLTDELEQIILQLGDGQAEIYLLWLQAFVAHRQGDLETARRRASDAVEAAQSVGDAFIVTFSAAILAAVDLSSGNAEQAHERLPALREALVGDGRGFIGSLTLVLWTYDIEALIATNRLQEAESLVDELLERAVRAANPNAIAIAHRYRALLLAAHGRLDDALERIESAIAEHAQRPLPFELGRTLLEKGTLERRLKRKSAAKQSLEQALAILEPLQAGRWLARTRDELDRVGLRRAAGDGITPAQIRVTELVLAGMTNREIAATLYMSLRTVETHLTKIYSHHGVRSRSQLIATLASATAASTDVARADTG